MSYVNSVTVYPSSATITKGKWYYGAYASISSNCPECAEVEWYSNSPAIASVNKTTGYIYGVNTGTTRIYAEATDGSGKKDYITVTVTAPVAVTGVSVCPTSMSMDVGCTDYLYETIYPSNATNQTVTWCSSDESVATVNTYTGFVRAKKAGVATITACTVDGGYSASCVVTVNYCGGSNYRDVTKHTMVLQNDLYYVCSKCGYRIKSPALQDKNILSDEDYYKVLSCYMSIPYYSKIDREDEGNYSIKATALRLIIDDIRSKSQYSQMYEYVGSDGVYEREYTVGNENDSYYMPVTINYNVIDNGVELVLNNGVAKGLVELLIGWRIPHQYQFLFFDLTDGYTNLTDFLSKLAENAGYDEIGIILNLILFGSSISEMAVTDKVVKIQFSVGSGVYETKTVFDSCGNLKFQEHST